MNSTGYVNFQFTEPMAFPEEFYKWNSTKSSYEGVEVKVKTKLMPN